MNIKIIFLFLFIYFFSVSVFAQEIETNNQSKYSFHFSFDGRRSFVNGDPSDLGGLRFGLEHNQKKFRFGVGIYFLKSEIKGEEKYKSQSGDTMDIRYNFGYPSIFFEKILFQNHKWELNSGLHLGAGNHQVKVGKEELNNFVVLEEIRSTVWELSGTADYYLTDWLALGTGLGYRLMVGATEDIRQSYSSPIYIIKLKVKLGKLHRFITRDPNSIEE